MPKSSSSAIHRTDIHYSNLTKAKQDAVSDLLAAYRKGEVALAHEQWRLFFETGRVNKNYDKDKITYSQIIGSAARVQMARYQVVGALQGWLSNRANEFGEIVSSSSLRDEVKHQLRHHSRQAGEPGLECPGRHGVSLAHPIYAGPGVHLHAGKV